MKSGQPKSGPASSGQHGTNLQWLVPAVAALLCVLPFLGKAIHIDDPMYLWAAHQIVEAPFDFYGFDVNWYGHLAPMFEVNKNPPLVSFYLAAVGSVIGWSEAALHVGMFLPLLVLVLAVSGLARRLTRSPRTASLLTLAMPVVIVSATTLMSDVLMLSLWCLALWLWLRGLDTGRLPWLVGAAIAIGLAPLAKYFGLALLPLAAVYAALHQRRVGPWLAVLGIPVAMLAAYEVYMRVRYGFTPFGDIAGYALAFDGGARYGGLERGLVGLLFLGGGLLPILFAAPLCGSRRLLLALGVAIAAGVAAAPALGTLGGLSLIDSEGARWGIALHVSVFAIAGLQILSLAAADTLRRRDPEAVLLLLWLVGTWVFAAYANWTITARAILPAAPAAALLLVRRLEAVRDGRGVDRLAWTWIPIAAGLLLSVVVCRGDAALAASAREAAARLVPRHARPGQTLYFQGAWGFQWYMERAGARRLRTDATDLLPGDIVIAPSSGTNLVILPRASARLLEQVEIPVPALAATLSHERGAGFYAALWGPLPFVLGPVPPQRYSVVEVVEPYALRLRGRPASVRRR